MLTAELTLVFFWFFFKTPYLGKKILHHQHLCANQSYLDVSL